MSANPFQPINSSQGKIYLETSFINQFAQTHKWSDARATKGFQRIKGNIFTISPVTIFELLQIKNEFKRELLIIICQNLFYERCLPSPEEIIIRHISLGCPRAESIFELPSMNQFALAWENIVLNTKKTFVYDSKAIQLQKTLLYHLFKAVRNFVKNNRTPKIYTFETHIKYTETEVGEIFSKFNINPDQLSLEQVFIYIFALAIMCGEIGIDPLPIQNYWSDLGIHSLEDRFAYLLENVPECLTYGPLASVGIMASVQSVKSPNAGAMFDCLHSVYISYSNWFFVSDSGFLSFREAIDPRISFRIRHFNELTWATHGRDVYTESDDLYL